MSDYTVDSSGFADAMTQILTNLGEGVTTLAPSAVEEALTTGEKAWKRNAKAVLSTSYSRGGWGKVRGGKGGVTRYKSGKRKDQIKDIAWYGKTFKTGRYARSIKHHMTSGGVSPEGEIGSASMPGLAHLLEKGHGYYTAAPHVHIEPAADEAFKDFDRRLDEAIDKAISDA